MNHLEDGCRSVYEPFLWNLVEEGHAIASEVSRLSDLIPSYFTNPSSSRFKPILFNFNYFSSIESFESNTILYHELGEEFFSENKNLILGFNDLLNSFTAFLSTFKQYLVESQDDSAPIIDKIRELELESFYLVSLCCLLLEKLYPPQAREILIVAVFRYCDDRNDGLQFALDFLHPQQNDADTLYCRLGFPIQFVDEIMVLFTDRFPEVGGGGVRRLRPLLSPLLFLVTCFSPPSLSNPARCSRLLDLFFPDDWVICVGGLAVNLLEEWGEKKQLNSLLSSRFSPSRASQLTQHHMQLLLSHDLPHGKVTLTMVPTLIPLILSFNASLRWLCLHSYEEGVSRKRAISALSSVRSVLAGRFSAHSWLSSIARVENRVFSLYSSVLSSRSEMQAAAASELDSSLDSMIQLISLAPNLPLKAARKESLLEWLTQVREKSSDVSHFNHSHFAVQLNQRLNHVVSSMGLSLVLASALPRFRSALSSISVLSSLSVSQLSSLKHGAAAPYAVEMLGSWVDGLEEMLLEAPSVLRALCSKLFLTLSVQAAMIRTPEKRVRVERALRGRLSRHLRRVLQRLPKRVFGVVDVSLLPQLQKRWPSVLDKNELKDLADVDERLALAEGSRALANLGLGISSLSSDVLGSCPREFLAESMKEELSTRLERLPLSGADGEKKLSEAALQLRSALISASEQLRVPGALLWRTQVADIFKKQAKNVSQQASIAKKWEDSWIDEKKKWNRLPLSLIQSASNRSPYSACEMAWLDTKSRHQTFSPSFLLSIECNLPGSSWCMSEIVRARCALLLRQLADSLRPALSSLLTTHSTHSPQSALQADALSKMVKSVLPRVSEEVMSLHHSLVLLSWLEESRRRGCCHLAPLVWRASLDAWSASGPSLPPSLLSFLRHSALLRPLLKSTRMDQQMLLLLLLLVSENADGVPSGISALLADSAPQVYSILRYELDRSAASLAASKSVRAASASLSQAFFLLPSP